MRIYELETEAGDIYAFEVDVPLLGRRRVSSFVRRIPGVTVTKSPSALSWFREEVFCRFTLGQVAFEVLEPFGDNSRYWVGPADSPAVHAEIHELIEAFRTGR